MFNQIVSKILISHDRNMKKKIYRNWLLKNDNNNNENVRITVVNKTLTSIR